MYKPDPRLPPDQQVIPTHAKRMQQEQWEREGKVPAIYGRDFSPLTVQTYDSNGSAVKPLPSPNQEPEQDSQQKPQLETLSPTEPLSTRVKSPDPATNAVGYKTVPSVQSTSAQARLNSISAVQPKPVHVEAPPAKEKGCGCCIVM